LSLFHDIYFWVIVKTILSIAILYNLVFQILQYDDLTSGISDTALVAILGIALILGLLLTFVGKLLWVPMMSIIGGFVGATIGFVLGTYFGGLILGLIGALIGGLLGSYLFAIFVEAAISILAGLVVFGIFVNWDIIIALIVGFLVFIFVAIFIEKIIAVLTATVGGLLAGVSLFALDLVTLEVAAITALVLIVVGSLVQTFVLEDRMKTKRDEAPYCATCGRALAYDKAFSRWYCISCQSPPPPPPPPDNRNRFL